MNRREALCSLFGSTLLPLASFARLLQAEKSDGPFPPPASRSPLPRVRVHEGGHLLQTADGRPFIWFGDSAWMVSTGRIARPPS